MKKRILSILLALCLVLTLFPETAWAAETSGICGDNLTWSYHDGILDIEGTGSMNHYGTGLNSELHPWYNYDAQINTVRIGDGVTNIGAYAFWKCRNLTNVTIPESIIDVGYYAFDNCSSLTSVTIPHRVRNIYSHTFSMCTALTDITLPGDATIEKDAFEGCTNIKNVKLIGTGPMADHIVSWTDPKSDTNTPWYIGSIAGNNIKVEIADGITSIGADAFLYCKGLTHVTIPSSVTSIKMRAFLGCSSLTSVTIPSSVSDLDEGLVFADCTSLTTVIVSSGVSNLGNYTFRDCSALTSITIPNSVINIGSAVFDGCNNLKDIYYSGSEADWAKISIDDDNTALTNATIHYNSTGPDNPGDGSLELNNNNANWTVTVGETLKVTAQMTDGSTFDVEKLQWTLSDTGIAAFADIVDNGWEGSTAYVVLRGVRPGKTTLTASMPSMTAPGVIDTNPIRVSQEITVVGQENIRFEQDTYTVMVGETIDNMIVSVPNPNGLTFNDINFNCISSDSEIASVTSWKGPDIDNGLNPISITVGVKGANVGTATITASVGDGRSVTCKVVVGEKVDVGFKPVIGQTYPIKVGNSGRSYAPVPIELKGKEISWEWKSSDGNVVSFNQDGILSEMGGEGKLIVSDEISEQFYARDVGTVTLTCSVDGTVIFKQDVIVVGPDDNRPVIDSNDYNVQLRGDAEDVFDKEFEVLETTYKKLLNRMDEKLDKPESIYPVVNPSIEEQALALLTHDKDKKQKEKFLLFSPSTPDELKLCCYHVFCEQLFNAAKDAGFSLKDISLGDPYQTALITKMAKFAGEKLDDDFPMADSNGRKVTVEANFVSYPIGDATGLGTMKCYYDSNPYKSYTCYLLPSYSSAEQSMKAYLQELIDLEYRAIKNIRSALVEDLISFDLKTLGEKGAAKVLDVMHKEAGALEEYKLLGLDGTISSCYDYGKAVLKLKSKIANSPADIKGIADGIEQLSQWEVPEVGNVLKREISSLKSAQKNFQQKVWSKLISKELPDWADRLIRVVLKCPVNVSVLKSNQLIGYAGDDDFWYDDGIVIEEYGDAKIIYYNPADGISFEITGTADGRMSYTVEEFNNGSPTGRINSDIILVSKGQVFTAHFPDKDLAQNQAEFSLTSNGETIQPMEYISASRSARVDVNAITTPTNSGDVYGAGSYVRGDAAVVYESPKDGYIFLGWYDNSGALISQDSVYEFSAMEDCTLEAKFTSHTVPSDEPESDLQVYLVNLDATGGTLESYLQITDVDGRLEEILNPVRDGYTFDGWYTATAGGNRITVDTIFTENTTIYAHWKENSVAGHTHNWATTWTSDANGHWHNCTASDCPITTNSQKNGYAVHTSDGGKVTTAATAYQNGVRTYSCTICGYVIRTESIPATGGSSHGGGSSSGGDGGSWSGGSKYSISTPSSTPNGTVRVSPSSAKKGDTVTITVKPDTGYQIDKLTVSESNGSELKLTDKGDSKFTFTMPGSKVSVEATFVKIEDTPTQPTAPSISFTDVASSAYYANAVAWAVEKSITVGTSATTFSPDAPCTRAQIVTFLWRAAGSPMTSEDNPFTDVAPGSYYYDAVQWAVAQGITVGTSATTFNPDATCTRGQTVTFLYRYEKSPAVSGGNAFTDVPSDAYYTNAVQWAVNNGVTSGTSTTTFSPDATCTRGQIVTFLYRDIA